MKKILLLVVVLTIAMYSQMSMSKSDGTIFSLSGTFCLDPDAKGTAESGAIDRVQALADAKCYPFQSIRKSRIDLILFHGCSQYNEGVKATAEFSCAGNNGTLLIKSSKRISGCCYLSDGSLCCSGRCQNHCH